MTEITCGNPRRKTLNTVIASILSEVGFDSVETVALDTLSEMIQSLIFETGNSSRAFYELAGRCQPVIGDVIIALVNMGIPVTGIEAYARRPNRTVVQPPQPAVAQKQPATLTTGAKQNLPPHIPDNFPGFPDPHAYIRTPTHKQPVTEYEAIREKSAIQKRDVERALTRFVAKTSEQLGLFASEENNEMFPLIAVKTSDRGYLSALIPRDQAFDPDESEMSPRKIVRDDEEDKDKSDEPVKSQDSEVIDNPYLRPVKMHRKMK